MRFAVLAVVGLLCACEQVIGIRDVVAHGTDGAVADGDFPPNGDGPGSGCVPTPRWSSPIEFSIPDATGTFGVGVGDLTGDGVVDVAIATGSDVTVFPGAGMGMLGASRPLRGSATPATTIFVTDMNDDGRSDLVAANRGALSIYLQSNTMPGSFDAPTTVDVDGLCDVADLNNDQFPDLVFCGSDVAVLLSSGGTFDPASQVTVESGGDVGAAKALDVDGDGFADIAFLEFSNAPRVAFNSSAAPGTFGVPIAIGPIASSAAFYGHFSAGSAVDVLIPNPSGGNYSLFDQTPPRVFTQADQFLLALVSNTVSQTSAIDLNGDGRDDVFAPGEPASYVLQCTTPGTFFPSASAGDLDNVLFFPINVVAFVGDISGDGKPDLIGFQNILPGSDAANTFEVAIHD